MLPYYNFTHIEIGMLKLQIWGIFFVLAIFFGSVVLFLNAKKEKIEFSNIVDFLFWLILGIVFGARIGYILTHINEFDSLLDYVAIWNGGIGLYGGLIGGSLFGILYLRHAKINIAKFVNILALSLPLSIAIGRIGCYLTGEHLGGPTNFFLGVKYKNITIHQTALYEVLINLFIFIFMLYLVRFKRIKSHLFWTFLLFYSFSRFFIDMIRIDEPLFLAFTASQWISILIFILSSIFLGIKKLKAAN